MKRSLLLEIGLEELPASFVEGALAAMPKLAGDALSAARLAHGTIRALGTSRRLALVVEDLAARQTDLSEVVVGPPKAAAFADDGTPKKAAEGFAKKLGLDVSALFVEETDKGPYVAGKREEAGRAAAEVLPPLLEELIRKIPFPKSMRWGPGEVAFGRPVHWIACVHGDEIVDLSFAGVASGRQSRGHRFLAPGPIDLKAAGDYVEALREAHVLVVPEELVATMLDALHAAAKDAGGVLVDDPFLVDENAGMVEEPHVVCGSFDEAFLALPDEVTIGVMRGHQRYFALRDASGTLMPRYLAVVNTALAPEVIVKGNDRVLRARLADAEFFVREDQKAGLESFVPRLDDVVFQAKLGTVGERVARLEAGVRSFPGETEVSADAERQAARLCKADLVSLIVGEFPELQGRMGRWYAEKAGVDAEVARAIEEHYLPRSATDDLPSTTLAAQLAVVDRADALVGCFGIGLIPSGSADPFALRRATIGVVRIALDGPIDVNVRAVLKNAWGAYHAQDKPVGDQDEVLAQLDEFFRGRLKAYFGERLPTDLVDACLGAWDGGSLRDLNERLDALEAFRRQPAYESLAVAFKRAYNIAKDVEPAPIDPELLTEDAERALAERWASLEGRIAAHTQAGQYGAALTLVAEQLREPIDRFFDEVFVMVDDPAVRDNRLRLLGSIARTLTAIAHFHLLGSQTPT